MTKRLWILVAAAAILAGATCAQGAAPKRTARAKTADGSPDPARVAEIAKMLPERPQGVGRPISDRQAWDAVARARGFGEVIRRSERSLREPMPELPDDLYLDYSRTGNRDRYQGCSSAATRDGPRWSWPSAGEQGPLSAGDRRGLAGDPGREDLGAARPRRELEELQGRGGRDRPHGGGHGLDAGHRRLLAGREAPPADAGTPQPRAGAADLHAL